MEEDYLESVKDEGKIGHKQDILLYGKKYHLWRNKEYIGIATYTNDENIGDSFISKEKSSDGYEYNNVYRADEWEFVK
jgi:hypothetical protein